MRSPLLPCSRVMSNASLEPFLPAENWFSFRPHGIHGLPHVTRVLFWSAVLTNRITQPDAIRWRELYWAAAVHDVARVDDGVDPGHGERAADWVQHHLAEVRPETASLGIGFIAALCRWHQAPDHAIEQWTLELMILKDADGLDRCRISDLDSGRLRLQTSLGLVGAAERLEAATCDYGRQGTLDTLRQAEAMFPRLSI